jgi:hypothetical protein
MNRAPSAAAAAAQKIDADHERHRGRDEEHEVPSARRQFEAGKARRIDHDAGREAPLGFIFAAEIDDDEVQRESRDRKIEPAQPQRRQPEYEAKHDAGERRGRQRQPERCVQLARKNAGGEGASRNQPRMAERDLPGIAGEQHQRQSADRG